jgi:hypothetical protein
MNMLWIPTPIYKALPYAYLLIAVICFYRAFESSLSILWLLSGSLFGGAGLIVLGWRLANQKLLTKLEA